MNTFRGDKYGFIQSAAFKWVLEGEAYTLRERHSSEIDFSQPSLGEGPKGALKSKFRIEDRKLISPPHLHFHQPRRRLLH